ncbi:N-alpha-acetyltransferase 35 NatC auxiliary subunit [Perkinsus olseni]|uniref:N-alpha-acetyltransferase 35 NatC auxiliary subunit n=3 Tax=Perkinsus olseni TaxID=32597 RepID=A0A7J6NKZ9_PEROL|nr:N-alpha-acetyltransferase 35 NatC auxiliary subunit [Perkinsus olseni]
MPAATVAYAQHDDGDWTDITNTLTNACSSMKLGQLVHGDDYSPFEAMSAIELMQPKMDVGLHQTPDVKTVMAEIGELSDDDAKYIADGMIAMVYLYFNGNTTLQTVWSCLLCHDLGSVHHEGLKYFLNLALRCSWLARDIMLESEVVADEDAPLALLGAALDQKKLPAVADCLGGRIAAFEALEKILESVQTSKGEGCTMATVSEVLDALQMAGRDAVLAEDEDRRKQLDRLFDASINNNDMPPGPPRQVPSLSREDAYSSMDSLLTDIGYAFEGLSRVNSLDNLEHFLEDLRHGSAAEQPLARAITSLRLMDTIDMEALVKDSLQSMGVPSDVWSAHKEFSAGVLSNCVRITQLRARTLLKSRSRQHRAIPKLIPEYNIMQSQAFGMDEMLEINYGKRLAFKKPTWTWVTDQAISLMQIEMQLTFELGLADSEEMPMLLWFEDYLIGVRLYALREMASALDLASKPRHVRRSERKNRQLPPPEPTNDMALLQARMEIIQGSFRMLLALQYIGLMSAPTEAAAKSIASRFAVRIQTLISSYRLPHELTFADFLQSTAMAVTGKDESDTNMGLQQIVMNSIDSMNRTGFFLDQVGKRSMADARTRRDVQQMRRVILSNILVLKQLAAGSIDQASATASASLKYHPNLITVALGKKKEAEKDEGEQ